MHHGFRSCPDSEKPASLTPHPPPFGYGKGPAEEKPEKKATRHKQLKRMYRKSAARKYISFKKFCDKIENNAGGIAQ